MTDKGKPNNTGALTATEGVEVLHGETLPAISDSGGVIPIRSALVVTNENALEFGKKFAEAQADIMASDIKKNAKVEFQAGGRTIKYDYATLDTILAIVVPTLNKKGLSLKQRVIYQHGTPLVETIITDGLFNDVSHMPLLFDTKAFGDDNIKSFGAALTYTKRYSLMGMLGIFPDSDTGGEGVGGGKHDPKISEEEYLYLLDRAKTKGRTEQDIIDLCVNAYEDPEFDPKQMTLSQYNAVMGKIRDAMPKVKTPEDTPEDTAEVIEAEAVESCDQGDVCKKSGVWLAYKGDTPTGAYINIEEGATFPQFEEYADKGDATGWTLWTFHQPEYDMVLGEPIKKGE